VTTVSGIVSRLEAALERRFEDSSSYTIRNCTDENDGVEDDERQFYVAQTCPICDVRLRVAFEAPRSGEVDGAWLLRELFASYDGHRCRIAIASADADRRQELFDRTEHSGQAGLGSLTRGRESVHMAERAQALAASDPELAARADRESAMVVDWAAHLERLV
jgi:hypothetical protein